MTTQKDTWLSENETALLVAIKCLAQMMIEKGVAKGEEIDAALLKERDRFAARELAKAASILQLVVMQRQRDDQSPSELSRLIRDLPEGSA